MTLLSFPRSDRFGGCLHLMPSQGGGYDVSHESSSGDSWGALEGPYQLAETAIQVAHDMARNTYGGCEVSTCTAALRDVSVGAGLAALHAQPGDF